MIEIRPASNVSSEVSIPGSKSYTHRLYIAAALSDGICFIKNPLISEDTRLTLSGLKQMGVSVKEDSAGIVIEGSAGRPNSFNEIYLGNCGTGIRFLTAVAALTDGRTVLTGDERMRQRPIADLLWGLTQMGIKARSLNDTGCPPVEVFGTSIEGGEIQLDCSLSSQYLSGILLIAPFTRKGLAVNIEGDLVSRPYIDLTIDVMNRLGVTVDNNGYKSFHISGGQFYKSGDYTVEPDASNASYFWAAAAVTGGKVTVSGLSDSTRQGDIGFLNVLEKMGCLVERRGTGITVKGGSLRGIDVDMGGMPDVVPTLAVVAAFARGKTRIRNIAHLRVKESDRIMAVEAELTKMGIKTESVRDELEITGGEPHGAEIETYNDHRIAMAFSIAGLKVSGIKITGESCVEKSFPTYWDVFKTLYPDTGSAI